MKKSVTTISLIIILNLNAMAKQITTQIVINATPQKVWAVLTNFSNYPSWNPFIKSVTGQIMVGNKITAYLQPQNAKGMTFKPRVLALDTNKEFRWLGHLLFPGLFDGEHKFELVDNGNGTTTFIQSEKFRGILIPFFANMLNNGTKNGFIAMNEKLKEIAEGK